MMDKIFFTIWLCLVCISFVLMFIDDLFLWIMGFFSVVMFLQIFVLLPIALLWS